MDTVALSWENDRRRAELTARPGQISLVVDRLQHVDADEEGRLLRAILGPSTWRRSYADRYVEIRSEAVDGERFHIPYAVGPHEALTFMLRVRSLLLDARAAAQRQGEAQAQQALDRILAWEADLLADDGQRFRKLFPSLGPLPPDQQTALVLQVRPDLEAHVQAVLKFLGRARAMRRGVYLDGVPDPTALAAALGAIRALTARADGTPEPIAASLQSLQGGDWPALASAGLTKVYASLDALHDLGGMQAAGLAVSLVTPAPPTVDEAEALAARVNALDLRGADTVYTLEPQPYPYDATRRMTLRRAFHHFKSRLRFPDNPAGPVVTHYPVLQSVY